MSYSSVQKASVAGAVLGVMVVLAFSSSLFPPQSTGTVPSESRQEQASASPEDDAHVSAQDESTEFTPLRFGSSDTLSFTVMIASIGVLAGVGGYFAAKNSLK